MLITSCRRCQGAAAGLANRTSASSTARTPERGSGRARQPGHDHPWSPSAGASRILATRFRERRARRPCPRHPRSLPTRPTANPVTDGCPRPGPDTWTGTRNSPDVTSRRTAAPAAPSLLRAGYPVARTYTGMPLLRHHSGEDVRHVHRDAHAAVRDRLDRDVCVAVNGVPTVEEHGVNSSPSGAMCSPSPATWCGNYRWASSRTSSRCRSSSNRARRDVADQHDLVAAVHVQHVRPRLTSTRSAPPLGTSGVGYRGLTRARSTYVTVPLAGMFCTSSKAQTASSVSAP